LAGATSGGSNATAGVAGGPVEDLTDHKG